MTTPFYTLNDYTSFAAGAAAVTFSLETSAILQFLSNKFGGNVTASASTNDVRQRDRKPRNKGSGSVSDASWAAMRDFKPTVIAEKKEGVEQWMSEIRSALNKISVKNYDLNSTIILEKLREIRSNSVSGEELKTVATNIFEVASTNKFFSEIYANLYKQLMTEVEDVFSSILDMCIQGFSTTLKSIQYVDQNTNYDEFCKYNKENDKRRATAVFITNLAKVGVIENAVVFGLVQELYDALVTYMNMSGKLNEVEEITENIFLLLTTNTTILRASSDELKTKIKSFAGFKAKDFPSMSSRAIFKYVDIMEKMNKSAA